MAMSLLIRRAVFSTKNNARPIASLGRCYGYSSSGSVYLAVGTGQPKTLEFHRGNVGGHHERQTTNILSSSSKWPTLVSLRFLSSGESPLEEDDVNVYFDGLKKRIESGDIQMIDVRDDKEIEEYGTIIKEVCHIPVLDVEAALHLPAATYLEKYGQAKPKMTDDNIVFTCKKGIRSLKARYTARKLGYTKAKHYPGGWMEWGRRNNLPFPKE